jgi:uncharacterized protein YndB with AHSA1/START domain
MTERNSPATGTADREVVLTRVFDAPRALVFKAWTDPLQLANWWGPKGFTNPVCELDVRPSGGIRIDMTGPDGAVYPMKGVFHEVVEPERLVFTSTAFEDEQGRPRLEVLNTVTFAEHGGQTKLTLRAVVVKSTPELAAALAGMEEGWGQSLERLAELTMRMVFPSAEERDRVIKEYRADEGANQTLGRLAEHPAEAPAQGAFVLTRTFDAPRDLVFKAWAESERLARWWGPKGFTLLVGKLEFRPGGVFHYAMRSPDGRAMWGKFVYRAIVPPERIVFVNSFADEAGNLVRAPFSPTWPLEVLSTVTFSEHGGKTTLTLRGVPLNATEAERKSFEAGHESMQKGWAGTLDQLAGYLAKA